MQLHCVYMYVCACAGVCQATQGVEERHHSAHRAADELVLQAVCRYVCVSV